MSKPTRSIKKCESCLVLFLCLAKHVVSGIIQKKEGDMKKLLLTLLVGILVSASMIGCGSKSEADNPSHDHPSAEHPDYFR